MKEGGGVKGLRNKEIEGWRTEIHVLRLYSV